MTNKKISALTASTTPLAGTELVPIVQSSATVSVSIANLTAGRAVSASTLTSTGTITSGVVSSSTGAITLFSIANDSQMGILNNSTEFKIYSTYNTSAGYKPITFYTSDVLRWQLETSGTITQKTAATGIDFAANTPLAGKTSTLLNWYEEGTWTPNQGAGLTLVGAFSSTGKYTRIGRQVSISGTVTGATSVALAAAGVVTSNLPFTVGTAGHGGATNVANTASSTVICTGTSVTSAGAIAATATITFSATYFA